jgi:hypothetical protein
MKMNSAHAWFRGAESVDAVIHDVDCSVDGSWIISCRGSTRKNRRYSTLHIMSQSDTSL